MGDTLLVHNDIARIIHGERGNENTSFPAIPFGVALKHNLTSSFLLAVENIMRDFRTHVTMIRRPPNATSRDVTSCNGEILGHCKMVRECL